MKKILLMIIILTSPCITLAQQDDAAAVSAEEKKIFSIQGFTEIENYIFTRPDMSRWNKYEGRAKADITMEKGPVKAKTVANAYACLSEDSAGYCEDRINVQQMDMTLQFDRGDIKIGKSVYKWGTADSINPTSYFNPFDLEEMLMKDKDELYIGVPSVSGTLLFGDFSLQGVFVPVFTASKTAAGSSPWRFSPSAVTVGNPLSPGTEVTLPVIYNNTGNNLTGMEAVGYGAQFSGSTAFLDFALSFYHGPDRDLLLSSRIDASELKIIIDPVYAPVTSGGLSLSIPVGELVINAEGTYSFDKTAVTDIRETGETVSRCKKTGFVYYAAGINYWLKDDDFRLTGEYIQGIHLKDRDILLRPLFSDLIAAAVEKKFFNGTTAFEIKGMFSTADYGWMALPRAAYEISNTLIVEIAGAIFYGDKDSMFGVYSANDLVSLRVKYLF